VKKISAINGALAQRQLEHRQYRRRINQNADMKTYHVKFSYNGQGELKTQVRRYEATSPGEAFQKCLNDFPRGQTA
jgi:hypothetical protein